MSVPTAPKRGGGRNGDVQLAGKQGVAENVVNWAIDEDFLENYMTMLPANLSEDGDDDIDDIYDQQTASVPQVKSLFNNVVRIAPLGQSGEMSRPTSYRPEN